MSLQVSTVKKISLILLLSAAGIALRSVEIPVVPGVMSFTLGMIIPILAGYLMGIASGVCVGAVVGTYAAMFSQESPLIPFVGNICLGLFAGIGFMAKVKFQKMEKLGEIVKLIIPSIGGGMLPTLSIAILTVPPTIAIISSLLDLLNAFLAATVALIVERIVVKHFPEVA